MSFTYQNPDEDFVLWGIQRIRGAEGGKPEDPADEPKLL